MQRKALYSRATRTRSGASSRWLGAHRSASDWSGAPEPEPDLGPSLTARIAGALQRFAKRHERPLLVLLSVALTLGALGGYRLTHPPARALTQDDINDAVHYTLAHTPPPPADSAIAAAVIAPDVVEVEGFLSPAHAAALARREHKGQGGKAAPGEGATPNPERPSGPRALTPPPREPPSPRATPHKLPGAPPQASPGGKTAKPDEPEPDAIGSGVVVDQTGKVLTALHVITGTDRWVVVFADGTHSDATLVGSQPENDLAVLQPKHLPDELQPAALAGTGGLVPGDEVVATGFPFGIGPSVSAGVVSGLEREFVDPDNDNVTLKHLIQFDAAVNPGNSGGPLVNRKGEVIGIVTAILNPSGQHVFAGIGFAVPIQNAMAAVGENPL
jgi:S1-C subfamily serine protease